MGFVCPNQKSSVKLKIFNLILEFLIGEIINVPALVFNYLDKALDVEITLDNIDGEYEFTEISNEISSEAKRVKLVHIPAQSSAGVAFMLRPKIIGNIMLKYTAVSPLAGDAVHKMLRVVPEGVTEYANRAFLVNLKKAPEQRQNFDLVLPPDLVPNSEHIEVSVIGDLLGPLLNNLEHLLRMPTGCAEQTMSTLIPNYLVLKYLKVSNAFTLRGVFTLIFLSPLRTSTSLRQNWK